MKRIIFIIVAVLSLPLVEAAQLKIADIFADNMILQRDQENLIWGWAKPNSEIVVLSNTETRKCIADSDGKWKLYLPILPLNKESRIEVSCNNEKIIIKNVCVGEVWLASGQSNMEWNIGWGISNLTETLKDSKYPYIRFFKVANSVANKEQSFLEPTTNANTWVSCDSSTVKKLSAAAYFFAKKIHMEQKVPIGIIVSAWGGTCIEAWTSREMLKSNPNSRPMAAMADADSVDWTNKFRENIKIGQLHDYLTNTSYHGLKVGVTKNSFSDKNWDTISYPINMGKMNLNGYWGLLWLRKTFEIASVDICENYLLQLPKLDYQDDTYLNGVKIGSTAGSRLDRTYIIPKGVLRKGVNVISIRLFSRWGSGQIGNQYSKCIIENSKKVSIADLSGIWRYSNRIEPIYPTITGYQNKPSALFNAMINPLIPYGIRGIIWYQGEQNVGSTFYHELFSQMINDWRIRWKQGNFPFLFVQLSNYEQGKSGDISWPILRDSQLKTSYLPNVGMVTTIDIGDSLDVHSRNKKDVGDRLYLLSKKMVYGVKELIATGPVYDSCHFSTNKGTLFFSSIGDGLSIKENIKGNGFEIADSTGVFHSAQARILRNTIEIWADEVKKPTVIRYGWKSNPPATLFNKNGLPASPFNTDSRY